jgi:hypothetical protein
MTFQKFLTTVAVSSALAMGAAGAHASINVFEEQDDGAPVGGPFPNSDFAQAQLIVSSAFYGPVTTETFESLPVGYSPSFAIPGGTVTLSAPDFGAGFSGISNTTFGSVYGFNTTPGGSNWLGFPDGSATFTFNTPINAFGFFTTGLQTVFTSSLAVSWNDGVAQSVSLPINVNGGATYFGLEDGLAFSSVTITDISSDAWGIDDVTYSFSGSSTPEPATWALMLIGVGAVGVSLRTARRVRPTVA